MNPARLWIIGAVVVSAAVLLGGYFLGVAPQLDAAASFSGQKATVESQNSALEASNATLKEEFATIDKAKADLAALRVSVPEDAELSSLLSELNLTAATSQVSITGIKFGDGVPFVQQVPPAAVAADSQPVATATTSPSIAAPTSALLTPQNFVYVPVSIQVAGDYSHVLDYVAGVQGGQRLVLVNKISVTPAAAPAASEGEESAPPATGSGVTASIDGYAYVLLDIPPALVDPAPAPAS